MFKGPDSRKIRSVALVLAIAFVAAVTASTVPAVTQAQSLPTVGLYNINVSLTEPIETPSQIESVAVVLSPANSQTITVNYYTFEVGETEMVVNVPTIADTVNEDDEHVTGFIHSSTGTEIRTAQASGIIQNVP